MITVSIIQDQYTAHPQSPDETLPPEALRGQCEAYKQACLAPQLTLARQAIQSGTDLILFREDCNGAGNLTLHRMDRPDLLAMTAEAIPGGHTSECLSALARDGRCFVIGCFLERQNGMYYNTAVLFDRSGKVVGKYRKTHLPPIERLMLTPGDSLPIFDTEIGRIGILICYDMMAPEVIRCLALQGADMICWPSLGYGWWDEAGDFTVRSRAHDNQVYLLGALPSNSCIVSPYGDMIQSARNEPLDVLSAEIVPGADPLQDPHHHNSYITQTPSLRERHLFERQPHLYEVLTVSQPPLMDRYPESQMRNFDEAKQALFDHYRQGLHTLHWQTRPIQE